MKSSRPSGLADRAGSPPYKLTLQESLKKILSWKNIFELEKHHFFSSMTEYF